jgi:CDP-6-deoxy-D-xylo-4-hexulose-3-dehydrase
MSTIEGGIISTNDDEIYNLMRLKRSHGLARESDNKQFYFDMYQDLDKEFLFVTDGYNFRNHEMCAVLGLSQLERLNWMIQKRNQNYKKFIKILSNYCDKVHVPIVPDGISSFCFPLVFHKSENALRFKNLCEIYGVEHRPIIGGNLLKQPYLKQYKIVSCKKNLDVDIIHNNGVYLGNNHFVGRRELNILNDILKEL